MGSLVALPAIQAHAQGGPPLIVRQFTAEDSLKLGIGQPVPMPVVIQGRVVDAKKGKPLSGVTVKLSLNHQEVTTDADGRFLLQLDDSAAVENSKIYFDLDGYYYQSRRLADVDDLSTMNIEMKKRPRPKLVYFESYYKQHVVGCPRF